MFAKIVLALLIVMSSGSILAQAPPLEPGVSQELARWRAAHYSDVRYKLNLTLEKMSPVLKGTMEIRVRVAAETESLPDAGGLVPIVLDWRKIKGYEERSTVANVTVNGKEVVPGPVLGTIPGSPKFSEHEDHLIFYEGTHVGENVIKLDFTSPILTSGSAITRYVDKEDGSEYIYSLFVPSDASTAFPVFDQPDLKARFSLGVQVPESWTVIGNTLRTHFTVAQSPTRETDLCPMTGCPPGFKLPEPPAWFGFETTRPISTYVFAFAAGPFERVSVPPASAGGENASSRGVKATDSPARPRAVPPANAGGTDKNADPTTSIYVRKSQAKKFQPHAAEVFRLSDEGIKFLEQYFDYKFPFPKYDIVLIPEFPFGGMEHAGATFLREASVIFPSEPTANDHISRANVIFHEAAHQWFGDTVTMRWFDDLWLKEGFAEFMAYKTLEKVMPEYNAWKVFYERNKQAAYLTDSTKGTTPIYQPIANLSAAKSAYGNIVYRKAPSFLKQAEFYIGPDKFQTAVRAFLKKHEFKNADWEDLVKEFEQVEGRKLQVWAQRWVKKPGLARIFVRRTDNELGFLHEYGVFQEVPTDGLGWPVVFRVLMQYSDGRREISDEGSITWSSPVDPDPGHPFGFMIQPSAQGKKLDFLFPNYQDYGYGIFLLDDKSRDYVVKNIQNEKDDFLRAMMWGSLWDSVREGELDPKEYVELAIKHIGVEKDESTIQSIIGRVSTAMNYYMSEPPAVAGSGGNPSGSEGAPQPTGTLPTGRVSAMTENDLRVRLEDRLIERMQNSSTAGQRITYYRSFLNAASTERARAILKGILKTGKLMPAGKVEPETEVMLALRTKDRFDIVTRLAILGDPDAARLLADLEKTERSDEAKRYAYAAKAAFGTKETKEKYFNDFLKNKEISESWIEAAFVPFNSIRHSELTLPFLERALAELPNLKRTRKIFFINGWLGAFIGGQRDEKALTMVNKFLADNPDLDKDLRLKVLENVDVIERAVKIRGRYPK